MTQPITQVLLVPRNSGLSRADRDALRVVGIIVVTVRTPHEARLMSAERLPLDSNAMIREVAKILPSLGETTKGRILDALCKAINANNEAAK